LFRIIAATIVPALLLLMLELALFLAGYGTATSFLVKVPGRDLYSTNQRFGELFFELGYAKRPAPCTIAKPKPPDTYRIFVVGGSAAVGVPEPAVSFTRHMAVMLMDRFPDRRFELINSAIPGINSHVVRQIAKDCAGHQPDLFVVYMGNNELIGPYGAGNEMGGFTNSLAAIRWRTRLRSTRLGQLLRNTATAIARRNRPTDRPKGMAAFTEYTVAADDPRLAGTYDNFWRNLNDICRIAHDSGADVLLCTVPSNVRDMPPFASEHRTNLTPANEASWRRLMDKGIALAAAGKHAEAIRQLLAAARIDDRYAELHFRLGRCYLSTGEYDNARRALAAARDLDVFRFRADTQVNAIIRKTSQSRSNVTGVDAVELLRQHSKTSGKITGNEFFFDHVHLNVEGNYLIGLTLAEHVAELIEPGDDDRPSDNRSPSRQRCARLLALTQWRQLQMHVTAYNMLAIPPFTGVMDHAATQAERRRIIEAIDAKRVSSESFEANVAAHKRVLDDRPDDLMTQSLLASLLGTAGDYKAAEKQWRQLLRTIPDRAHWLSELGNALTAQDKPKQAEVQFQKALDAVPNDLNVHVNYAICLLQQGRSDAGLARLRHVLTIDPNNTPAHMNLGQAMLTLRQPDKASEHFEEVLRMNPGHDVATAKLNEAESMRSSPAP